MNGQQASQKRLMLAFLYLVVKRTALGLKLLLLSVSVYAFECPILQIPNDIVEQSVISEKVFGVERKHLETSTMITMLNEIYDMSLSYTDYQEIKKCIDEEQDRFMSRNGAVFVLALFGRVNNIDIIDKSLLISEENYVANFLSSRDKFEVIESIISIRNIKKNSSIDALVLFINSTTDHSLAKMALSSIHSIGGEYAKRKLIELSLLNEKFNDDIDHYLSIW